MKKSNLLDRLRLWPWLIGALIATAVIGILAPHQIGILLWSLSKLCFGAYLGYWIDRNIFNYARPGKAQFRDGNLEAQRIVGMWMLRRALIIAAALLALGLGV